MQKILIAKLRLIFPLLFILVIIFPKTIYTQKAFPSAEGYAANITGGRGGVVFEVTNLEDDVTNPPAGSLRAALKDTTSLPRTIVFRVSGVIILKGRLDIGKQNITIAGQTAPGDGICIRKYTVKVYGKPSEGNYANVIIRHIRFRPGEETHSNTPPVYGIDVENAKYVIIDHCSFSWSIEEACTLYDNKYVTLQWCIISESLKNAANPKGPHGYAGVWGGQYCNYHHNLIAHHDSRTPRFNGARAHDTLAIVDYRNNVIYNWGANSAYGGEIVIPNGVSRVNMINNYYKYGPATSSSKKYRIINPYDGATGTVAGAVSKWYISGNYVDGSTAITANNWSGGVQPQYGVFSLNDFKLDTPIVVPDVLTETAEQAYESVLANAGAIYPKRDTVDLRAVNNTRNRTAGIKNGIIDSVADVGGWPPYNSLPAPADNDHDGMPDTWESSHSLNPNNPEDRNGYNLSHSYTNLEVYLNEIANDPVGIEEDTFKKNTSFSLSECYPNPFNPSTNIEFDIPVHNKYELAIFDLLGREVALLHDGILAPGHYIQVFTASNLPSGLYIVRLSGNGMQVSRKIVLLK